MALASYESTPGTPLLFKDPNWKKRQDTIFKKAALFFRDFGTEILVVAKTDSGYDIFEPVDGMFNELTSRIVRELLNEFSRRLLIVKAPGP
jgi:hypothetical protein